MISVGGNAIRAALGLLSGLIVARGLSPTGYGELMFLITTMTTILIAIQMGSSSAFYTFLSQYSRTTKFYLFYYSWLAIQFVTILVSISFILPDDILKILWVGQSRQIVAVSVAAVFMQKVIWPMVGQIGESSRQTFKVQVLNASVAAIYLLLVSIMYMRDMMKVEYILYALIIQFTISTAFSYWFLKENEELKERREASFKEMVKSYWAYCKPLIILSIIVFLYEFLDKWMLQKFSGSIEQAYYQVALQISMISLLATTSIMRIFWKEIAEAWEKRNMLLVKRLYQRANRGLVFLGATVTGLLLPWTEHIVSIALGNEYMHGWPVLALMLFYPIHQSMGQVGGTMLMASGNTYKQMLVSMSVIIISIPATYYVLAPSDYIIPGLNMGAMGIAIKMVLFNVISVNLQAWVITRILGTKFDWLFQVVGITLLVGCGYLAAFLVNKIIWFVDFDIVTLFFSIGLSFIIYIFFIVIIIRVLPWLIGFDKESIDNLIQRMKLFFITMHSRSDKPYDE